MVGKEIMKNKEIIKIAINPVILNDLEKIAKGTNITTDDIIQKCFFFMIALFHLPHDKRIEVAQSLKETEPFKEFIVSPYSPVLAKLAKHDGMTVEEEVKDALNFFIALRQLKDEEVNSILVRMGVSSPNGD